MAESKEGESARGGGIHPKGRRRIREKKPSPGNKKQLGGVRAVSEISEREGERRGG